MVLAVKLGFRAGSGLRRGLFPGGAFLPGHAARGVSLPMTALDVVAERGVCRIAHACVHPNPVDDPWNGGAPWAIDGLHGSDEDQVNQVVHFGARHTSLRDGAWLQPEPMLHRPQRDMDRSTPMAFSSSSYAAANPLVLHDTSGELFGLLVPLAPAALGTSTAIGGGTAVGVSAGGVAAGGVGGVGLVELWDPNALQKAARGFRKAAAALTAAIHGSSQGDTTAETLVAASEESGKAPARQVDIQPGKSAEVGEELTMEEAVDCVKCGGDVIAQNKGTAREIAEQAGDGPPQHDQAHSNSKSDAPQKPHYHPTSGGERTGGHVLYQH